MSKEKSKGQSFENILGEDDYKYLKALDEEFLNDFDPNDESTKFTEQHYIDLEKNLALFKEGNREAGEYIIASFHRILHAYAHFIVLRSFPYRTVKGKDGRERLKIHPSILSFIKLFKKIENPAKGKGSCKHYEYRQEIKNTCTYIHELFKNFEYGEIYNELVLALLNMANKYKIITDPNDPKYKANGSFHMYVSKCFHFEAFHFLKQLIKDPLVNMNISLVSVNDENNIDTNASMSTLIDENALMQYNTIIDCIDRQIAMENSNALILKEDRMDVFDSNCLNFNWINGVTCDKIFKNLTPYERELLVLSYDRNQTEDTLAAIYGYARATIGSHRRRAVAKLKEAMIDSKKIKE